MVHCQTVLEKRLGARSLRNVAIADKDRSKSNPVCSRLNLERLESFEVVEEQFKEWGITLRNAIALQPSNAAYPPHSGSTLLMGAPRDGWMELVFKRPLHYFSCHVTSSQPIILSAYDRQGNLIARDELPQANLAESNSSLPPNAPLYATSSRNNIARISIYAFDGQLTVSEVNFCF
ncbi:hypothetical protein [Oscillatoria sp. FACHB-1406]|uniref:hypothetical protein n=1 Tax=Oscillatoria sp. FACHB-1406 TaxID=2692846 RepID=UPI001683DACC|nr:hypothetical protein [Oscillatoria sp. FACHB-1406]MBD2577033.1 hypothetical protein [Oscillatoria sp. FACHB-1406]